MSEAKRSETVEALMTGDPITVNATTPLGQVKAVMTEARIRHVPVVDEEGLLGVVSDRDVSFIHGIPGVFEGVGEADVERVMAAPVTKVMKSRFLVERDVETVSPQTSLNVAVEKLVANQMGSMPVVDEEGEVVGMISVVDVMRWVSGEVLA